MSRIRRWLRPWIVLTCLVIGMLGGCGSAPSALTIPTLTVPTLTLAPIFVGGNVGEVNSQDLALALAYHQLGSGGTLPQLAERANRILGSSDLNAANLSPINTLTLDFAKPTGVIDPNDLALLVSVIQLGSNSSREALAAQTNLLQGLAPQTFTPPDILKVPGFAPSPSPTASPNPTYVAENRTITSSGNARTFVLAKPDPLPAGSLPLVFALHGDGGTGAGIRSGLPLEAQALGGAVFVYPNAPGGTFEYFNDNGRTREAQFVQDVIDLLDTELSIDRSRVFITGFSGGATMANALGCRLGPTVIRGLGIHSGTLYPVPKVGGGDDFTYTASGGVSCPLPATLFVWGESDTTPGVSFAQGQAVRDNYLATQECSSATTPGTIASCVAYDSCSRAVTWCPIPGMGHSIWSEAAPAIWSFWSGLSSPSPSPSPPPPASTWILGYHPGYQKTLYPSSEVDFASLTHLAIGAVIPLADGSLDTTFFQDTVNGPLWAADLVQKAHAAGKKAILMVGGAGYIDGFRGAAAPANRATFVANLVALADQWGADGFDLDWEPLPPEDLPNFEAVAQALRQAKPSALLSVPVFFLNTNLDTVDPRWGGISALFDRVNIMTYEMAGTYPGWDSWHSSPLLGESPTTPSSVSSSVNAFRTQGGIPAAKLGVGIGFYGLCYTGSVTGPRQPLGASTVVSSDNDMSYTNIVNLYFQAANYTYDTVAKAPYLGFSAPQGPRACRYITYEDPQSVADKAAFAQSQGLGGTIIWTIGQGYQPAGATAAQKNPLLRAVKSAFLP